MKSTLVLRWEEESKKLNKNMKQFDKEFMIKNKEHNCNSKETFGDGTWYCDHLINARIRKFRGQLKEEERLLFDAILPDS